MLAAIAFIVTFGFSLAQVLFVTKSTFSFPTPTGCPPCPWAGKLSYMGVTNFLSGIIVGVIIATLLVPIVHSDEYHDGRYAIQDVSEEQEAEDSVPDVIEEPNEHSLLQLKEEKLDVALKQAELAVEQARLAAREAELYSNLAKFHSLRETPRPHPDSATHALDTQDSTTTSSFPSTVIDNPEPEIQSMDFLFHHALEDANAQFHIKMTELNQRLSSGSLRPPDNETMPLGDSEDSLLDEVPPLLDEAEQEE
ncbi:hypothetical protein SISSUDRAFT_1044275, partial [Sistotremastrum suecicum HHB10207 ss-3]